jgi:hypothetical protein
LHDVILLPHRGLRMSLFDCSHLRSRPSMRAASLILS